jgi:ankyrin repeat protein
VQNGQTALQVAVQSAGESVIRALRRHGARWTDVDSAGNNAVHYVSRAGRADLCKTRKSADWVMAMHQPNADGATPLHTILSIPETSATAAIIQAFVSVGADVNRRNAEGKSALDLAEVHPHLFLLPTSSQNTPQTWSLYSCTL